ncbi:GNAT family N-acetyltransferase [Micromonospora sp. KLBMP9576]|uniref:GNAT family N-acetyltransferase n=1 Tax=Micromonospora sp. KLBMP9576 TaxID=3424769 RepID=UPI003D8C8C4B
MTAQVLAGALADDVRRRVFAAIVLGGADATAVADRTGLSARQVLTAIRRLVDTGLVTGGDGDLRVDADRVRRAARTPAVPGPAEDPVDRVLRTFVRDGRLTGLPAQRGRRRVVLAHVAESFEPGERYPERAVDEVLRRWCERGGCDHVSLRRYLVDEQLLTREQGVYWVPRPHGEDRRVDTTGWTMTATHPDRPEVAALLEAYYEEMVRRYHGRPARPEEVAAAMADDPSDDLVAPTGVLLVAYRDGDPAACAGLRYRPGWAELTRVYVRPEHRGHGGGAALLAAVEERARSFGINRIRLDTRSDLVEARALYARHGYREIPAFNDGVYAEHWFEKILS